MSKEITHKLDFPKFSVNVHSRSIERLINVLKSELNLNNRGFLAYDNSDGLFYHSNEPKFCVNAGFISEHLFNEETDQYIKCHTWATNCNGGKFRITSLDTNNFDEDNQIINDELIETACIEIDLEFLENLLNGEAQNEK